MGGAVSDLHCRLLYRFIHIISIKTLVIMDTQKRRVLVLNPNSSKAMTEGMVKAIGEVQLPSVRHPRGEFLKASFLNLIDCRNWHIHSAPRSTVKHQRR